MRGKPVIVAISLICAVIVVANGEYLIGVGSYDMTGPAAQVNLMGYANPNQNGAGIHFRLRARAFIVAESSEGPRFAFVNLDAGMASQLVTIKVVERLKSRYGDLYNEENIAISGTHTHAGPGGYLQYLTYTFTALGFVRQSFDALVTAVELSIVQAHDTLKPSSAFINKGDVDNAGINRSPSAYLFNPSEERAKYPKDIDTLMTMLKFVEKNTAKSIGAFSWFATHGTSMSNTNQLISGDNKGAAARFFEDRFAKNSTSSNSSPPPNTPVLSKLEATGGGGQSCNQTTSQGFKVRKNDGTLFVGAFCQSNVGDVSPNVAGAVCIDTGLPCDFNYSTCNGNNQLCIGRGPGYPDEILSTRMIGERQFQKAVDLFTSATDELTGKIDYRHAYLNFTNIEVQLEGNKVVRTCPAAMGPGFAAGTTDGPGLKDFQQGNNTPAILPIQILKIGKLVILSVPGEFTTMAGRRLREAVKATLISNGNGEYNNETHVVIAGLTNTYSQYVATFEEYNQQRYEGASTLYGPHTLSAYIQEFNKLAKALATGHNITVKGPSPPDLLSAQVSLLPDPPGDYLPQGKHFGDLKQDVVQPPGGSFKTGDRVNATFWSANPRNDLLTEGTYAVVEMMKGQQWVPAYDDDDFSLFFKWNKESVASLASSATIEWEIPEGVSPGVYRLRHFGSSKVASESPNSYFTGVSTAFTVS
nr:neutral ceramidase-like [Ipomoea batatas]